MKGAALALLLAACCTPQRPAVPGECRTRCGLTAQPSIDCASLESFEARAVATLGDGVDGWSRGGVCRALRGWDVVLMHVASPCPTGWFEQGFCVIGYTRENSKTVAVLGPKFRPLILGHEFVHVVDLTTRGRAGHCHWINRGVVKALERLSGEVDDTEKPDTCKHEGGE